MSKKERPELFIKFRKLINDSFDYLQDTVLRDEVLEMVDDIEAVFDAMKSAGDIISKQNIELIEEVNGFKAEVVSLTNKLKKFQKEDYGTIDFGIGSLYYHVHKESSITVKELMDAIKNAALIVPLTELTNAIKNRTRF